MPQAPSWHSALESVHHNNTTCRAGDDIKPENLRLGTGGKPLCPECARLNEAGE